LTYEFVTKIVSDCCYCQYLDYICFVCEWYYYWC